MRPKNYDTDENSMPKEYAKVEERMHSCLYYLSFIVVLNLHPFFSNDTFNDAQLCLFIKTDMYFAFSRKILRGLTAFHWKGCLWMQCCNVTVGSCLVTNSALHGKCHNFISTTTLSTAFCFARAFSLFGVWLFFFSLR